ncbi:hypothetical protein ABT297_42500 [Dactylosporangium sp. NPDC000555]|uniref:hypothetical protein n=1 Tax=Dactylosporangium sp. NPDC000555 TaxID=3154260 RepID=UPI00331863E9
MAVEQEQSTLGYNCIAAGIRDHRQHLVGVIGVAGRTGFAAHRLSRPLLAVAGEVERGLRDTARPIGPHL